MTSSSLLLAEAGEVQVQAAGGVLPDRVPECPAPADRFVGQRVVELEQADFAVLNKACGRIAPQDFLRLVALERIAAAG